jgi:hypothetical protein
MSTNRQQTTGSYWSFLLVKGPAGFLLSLVAAFSIPLLLWAVTGAVTGDGSTADVVFVVTFVVVAGLLLIRFVVSRRSGVATLMLLCLLGGLALLASAHSPAAGAGVTQASSPLARNAIKGGFDSKRFDPPNLRLIDGCSWAKVWHNGHNPALAVRVAYRVTLRVDWCVENGKFKSVRIRFGPTKLTESVDYKGDFKDNWVTQWENCDNARRITVNGCLYIRRAARVVHELPLRGRLLNAYPWVSIRISVDRRAHYWAWSESLW